MNRNSIASEVLHDFESPVPFIWSVDTFVSLTPFLIYYNRRVHPAPRPVGCDNQDIDMINQTRLEMTVVSSAREDSLQGGPLKDPRSAPKVAHCFSTNTSTPEG